MRDRWRSQSRGAGRVVGGLVAVPLIAVSIGLLVGSASAWAASKHQFPTIRGDQLLRHHAGAAPDDIEFIYLYGSLGLLQAGPEAPKPPDVHLSTEFHRNVIPLFKHDIYHDIDVYLQAEYIDYTIAGLLENTVFDEIDHIAFENDWNHGFKRFNVTQEKGLNRHPLKTEPTNDIFRAYNKAETYSMVEILSPDILSGFQSIVSTDRLTKGESLSAPKQLYDLANDQWVDVQSDKEANKQAKKTDATQESGTYARAHSDAGLTISQRDGIMVRLFGRMSATLKYFYAHKVQGILVGMVCIGVYLFLNAIVLRKYMVKG